MADINVERKGEVEWISLNRPERIYEGASEVLRLGIAAELTAEVADK